MNINIDNSEIDQLLALWQQAPEIVNQATKSAVTEAQLLLLREVKENTPVGSTSLLRQSFGAPEPILLGDRVIGVVGTSLQHAIPVELGTKPHFPPVAPIKDWVKSKLGKSEQEAEGIAFAVARKISIKGTKPKLFVKKTFDQNKNQAQAIFSRALGRIAGQLGNG